MEEPSITDSFSLSPNVSRLLSDRVYDKRKQAAQEIEFLVRELGRNGDNEGIRKLARGLISQYCLQMQSPNMRKGGLIGLAAIGLGLGKDISEHLSQVVPPVLHLFGDSDNRVRYYACEALYNIAKVARTSLIYRDCFNLIFEALCDVCCDFDAGVREGAGLLTRLMKDIVAESEAFDIGSFIPVLKKRIYIPNPYLREFFLGWITFLDNVPALDMLEYLPEYLDGLLNMLSDEMKQIRKHANAVLGDFLKEIRLNAELVAFDEMVAILVERCQKSKDDFSRLTALTWIKEFIVFGRENMLPLLSSIISAVLPCLSQEEEDIQAQAQHTHHSLLLLVRDTADDFDIDPVIAEVVKAFANVNERTRLAALHWVIMLLHKMEEQVLTNHLSTLTPVLMRTLSDESKEVVSLDLEILARICRAKSGEFFISFLEKVVELFVKDRDVLAERGAMVIRRLCLLLSPTDVYMGFAQILEKHDPIHHVPTAALSTFSPSTPGVGSEKKQHGSPTAPSSVRSAPAGSTTNTGLLAQSFTERSGSVGKGGSTSGVLDLDFLSLMVQTLNLILLTSPELFPLRSLLRGYSDADQEGSAVHTQRERGASATSANGHSPSRSGSPLTKGKGDIHDDVERAKKKSVLGKDDISGEDLFLSLYPCWAFNPVATFSLCLLAQKYRHASEIVLIFGEMEMSVDLLLQIDKLVQLIESPFFSHLRVLLLEPAKQRYLYKALYGILMVLPQGKAFTVLKTRLETIPVMALQSLFPGEAQEEEIPEAMLMHAKRLHQAVAKETRKKKEATFARAALNSAASRTGEENDIMSSKASITTSPQTSFRLPAAGTGVGMDSAYSAFGVLNRILDDERRSIAVALNGSGGVAAVDIEGRESVGRATDVEEDEEEEEEDDDDEGEEEDEGDDVDEVGAAEKKKGEEKGEK